MSVVIVNGGDTLTLPNPKYNNSKFFNVKTKFKRVMSDKIHSYINTPVNKKLFMIFDILTGTDITNIIEFFKEHMKDTLSLTDWDNIAWTGKVISNPLEMITIRDDCSYSMVLEFEGAEV